MHLATPALTEADALEIDVQHRIFHLYGLTPDEVRLLRSTAPPRDPLALVERLRRQGAIAHHPLAESRERFGRCDHG